MLDFDSRHAVALPIFLGQREQFSGRTPASQAGCHGFDPRLPLQFSNSLAWSSFLLCAQKCSECFEISLHPLPGLAAHDVIRYRIYQLSHTLWIRLGVLVEGGGDVAVA